MGFFAQIALGIKSYFRAIGLSFNRKIFPFYIIPVILNIALFYAVWHYTGGLIDSAESYVLSWFDASGFWAKLIEGFVAFIIRVAVVLAFVFFGGYIIIIIMTPVYSMMSERAEKIIKGDVDYPFSFVQLLKDIWRGIVISIRNMSIETAVMIIMFFVGLIPVIGFIAPVIVFVTSSYFYGFAFMDFMNERKKRGVKQSVGFVRKYKWLAITNGAVYALFMLSVWGVAIAAFFGGVSTIAATVAMIELEKNDENEKL